MLPIFQFIGGFCPESGALGLSVLIGEFQGRQRTGFGKAIETDVTILETGCGTDRQVPLFPVIACCDENVEIAAVGAAVGGALECRPARGISAWTATHSGIQVESVAKDRSVHADFSGIDIDVAAGAVDIDAGVGVAGGQTNRKVRSHAIIHAEGKASGINVIAGCIGSTVDVGELAQARDKDTPAVARSGREYGWAALTLRSTYPGKALSETGCAAVYRKAGRAEAGAATRVCWPCALRD